MPSLLISCVSDEFGNYRDVMKKDFTRPDLDAKIQEDFISFGGPTLEKLDEYIRHCDAVIHIIGDMTGSMINEFSRQYLNKHFPDFGTRFPELKDALKGDAEVSYTQCEAYLAIYYNKRLFITTPTETAQRYFRYRKDIAQTAMQEMHLDNLKARGYYDEIHFTTEDELVKKLSLSKLADILHKAPKVKPVNLPYKSIESNFKGRHTFFNDLYNTFFDSENNSTAVAVYGLGGVGKTRAAVEYAWQYQNNYIGLLFVSATSPEQLKANIANLCGPQILNLAEHAEQEEDGKYSAVLNWLNSNVKWLLVIDEVDTLLVAKHVEHLFASLQHGHILITGRIGSWSPQIKRMELGLLKDNEASLFLLESTDRERQKTEEDTELASAIANDLGYLALALEQARAYISTNELSFKKYRLEWDKSRHILLSWHDEQQMQYPASVAATWLTSLNYIPPSSMALLNLLAWFSSDPIPKTLLEVEFSHLPNINLVSAWEALKQYSLATSTEDRKSFKVHKLVQEVTRQNLETSLKLQSIKEALEWIDEAFIGDARDVFDWPKMEPLIPHVLSVTSQAEAMSINYPTSKLIRNIAIIFLMKAQYESAEILLQRALQIDELYLGTEHPDVATDLNCLVEVLQATGRLKEAEQFVKRALIIDEKYFGPDHTHVARDLNNLGQVYFDLDRLEEAESVLRKSLSIDINYFHPYHQSVALRYNNLAQVLKRMNRLEEAEKLMRSALEIDEQYLGVEDPIISIRLNNLALLLQNTHRFEEAEALINRSLEIDQKCFGTSHPRIATGLNNLATLLQDTKRFEEVELLLKRAADIDYHFFGLAHPKFAKRLNNLALYYHTINRHDEAEPLYKQSLTILFKSLGASHSSTKIIMSNYTMLLTQMGASHDDVARIIDTILRS